jgi:actin-related protein
MYSDVVQLTAYFTTRPATYAWHGGKLLSNSEDFPSMVITKAEYQEQGKNACRKKFGGKEK